jgi:rfaE bifunctional protein nucleotidyltransferase chain/domain
MAGIHDIFGPGSNVSGRIFRDYGAIAKVVESCRSLGMRIVLTSGTFDLFHIGHSRYLEKAKQHGDILIVGVDSDEKVRQRKGPHRPVVPEDERMEILCHSRYIDLVFLKQAGDPRWELIKVVHPDVLIMTQENYVEEDGDQLREYCGVIVVLEPQATTSTTAKIRLTLVGPVTELKRRIGSGLGQVQQDIFSFLDELTGGEG